MKWAMFQIKEQNKTSKKTLVKWRVVIYLIKSSKQWS